MPTHRGSRRHPAFRDRETDGFASDGEVEPSLYFGAPAKAGPDRKTLQLCRQLARALSLILGGECDDALLRDVFVESVTPAPDASRVLVTVMSAGPVVDPDHVLARLHARRAFLRGRAAEAIHRKRVPEFSFCVAGVVEEER